VRQYDPARIFALDVAGGVSHEQLFPQVAAVVHHAGSGTVGTALRAGKSQICCPFRYDQPFWSQRLLRLGVAPAPLPMAQMSAEGFRRRLEAVLADPQFDAAAKRLQELIRRENGVGTTVARLEHIHAVGQRPAA
jgi:sterol 3beta-glucosyltransferase